MCLGATFVERNRNSACGCLWCAMVATSLLVAGCAGLPSKTTTVVDGSADGGPAKGMIRASRGRLAPVYAPLAEFIVGEFDLAGCDGVGIDVGSGPGTLIIELAKRTKHHWVNADIDPNAFTFFHETAGKNGLTGRVSSIRADVHELPFRDGYADVIVSRGSYHFWKDKVKAFNEIYRVLKPGGVAFIGRGFSPNLPVETAREIRAGQGKSMEYSFAEESEELTRIMREVGVARYKIHNPSEAHGNAVNYGIWVELHKLARDRQ